MIPKRAIGQRGDGFEKDAARFLAAHYHVVKSEANKLRKQSKKRAA